MATHAITDLLEHRKALRRLARDLVGASNADDVLQDAAFQLVRTQAQPTNDVLPWLRGVIRNLAGKRRRALATRKRHEAIKARPDKALLEAGAETADTMRWLTEQVVSLPEPYRSTLLARYVSDHLPAQIAADSGTSLATVKTRLRRGVAMLRERCESRGKSWRPALVAAFGIESQRCAAVVTTTAGTATGWILMRATAKTVLATVPIAIVLLAWQPWQPATNVGVERSTATAAPDVVPSANPPETTTSAEPVATSQPQRSPAPLGQRVPHRLRPIPPVIPPTITTMKTALASNARAQVSQFSIGPQIATYNGAAESRAFHFTAAVDFYIGALSAPADNQIAGDFASYQVDINGVNVFFSTGNTGHGRVVTPGIPQILIGDTVMICGHWGTTNYANNSYAGIASGAPIPMDIEGVPHVIYGAQLNTTHIAAPGYVPVAFTHNAGPSWMGRCDVYISSVPTTFVLSEKELLGSGCGGNTLFPAFYEEYADNAIASAALNDASLLLTPTLDGYSGAWAPGTAAALYVPPTAAALPLATGDDGQVTVTPAFGSIATPYGPEVSIQVHGNGIIGFGPGLIDLPAGAEWDPTAAGMLSGRQAAIYAWHDYNPTEPGSGAITSEEVGNMLYITWDNVESYSSSYPGPPTVNPSTLQFQIDMSSSAVTLCFVNISALPGPYFGEEHLVGIKAPGASPDPGSTVLATSTLFTTTAYVLAVELDADGGPVIGCMWDLTVSEITPTTVFGVNLISVTDPMIMDPSLAGIDMPGCQLRSVPTVVQGPWFTAGATSYNYSFDLTGVAPALMGFELYMQAVTFDANPVNGFGAVTTNGVRGRLGTL